MPTTAASMEQRVEDEAGKRRSQVARLGLVGKGLLYCTLGLLVTQVATGDRSSASASGAVERVAAAPFGRILLIILTVTLLALVAWKVLQLIAGDPLEGSEPTDRAMFGLQAVLYGTTAVAAVSILVANWSGQRSAGGGGGGGQQEAAGWVMGLPAGRWIVAAVGLGVILYGLYSAYGDAIEAEFMERIEADDDEVNWTIEVGGRVGYAVRGIFTVGVGIFLLIAGLTHEPGQARGLSGVLQELSGQPWGPYVLWPLAVGLLLFGLFSLAEARYRRAT